MATIETLRARVAKASAKMEALQSKIMPPGDYEFTVLEAKEEHDDKREYDYWYLGLDCGRQATSDRFPLTDNMLWKLGELLEAVGLELESLTGAKDLVGRSGKFIAVKKGEQGKEITVYQLPAQRKLKKFGRPVILRRTRGNTRSRYRYHNHTILAPAGVVTRWGAFLHFFLFSIQKRRQCPF
jgi:hypothetical protein